MDALDYPLSILVKAVAFRNLSAASRHVGLSQPQLSRLVARLEEELGFSLLDRQVRRKSAWTPQALQLSELFSQSQGRLHQAIRQLQGHSRMREVHIGTLEGLADEALRISHQLYTRGEVAAITLDVLDRGDLEARFLAGDLDCILNTRVPSRSKYRFIHTLGFQTLHHVDKKSSFEVFSSFEFNSLHGSQRRKLDKKSDHKTLISNSLHIRKTWIEQYGGRGYLPSALDKKSSKGCDEVILLAADNFDPALWLVIS